MPTEQRVSRLEGVYKQVDARLDDLSQSVDSSEAERNRRFNNILKLLGFLS